MKILVLSNLYPPAAVGGYERMCRDVVERFRGAGHTVVVLTTTFGEPTQESDPEVHRLLGIYWNDSSIECPSLRQLFRCERANQRSFARLLASFQPDLISVWGMGAMSLGLLATAQASDLPIVYVVGDDWLVFGRWADCWTRQLDARSKLTRRFAQALGAPAAPESFGTNGTLCFVSDYTRQRAWEESGVEVTRAQVIPAGIDPHDFPLAQPHVDLPWRWRILCVGRLVPGKRLDVAIRALAELPPEATLTIVGRSGPAAYRAELQQLAHDTGTAERIIWTACDRSEMAAHYYAADVLVFPSSGHEAFGLVPLEAMACATPVVASGVGGSAEFLADNENCVILADVNAADLVAALERLSRDTSLRRRIVTAGLDTAARLTVDRQTAELEKVHRCAVEQRQAHDIGHDGGAGEEPRRSRRR